MLGAGFDLSLTYGWTDARDESDGEPLLLMPAPPGPVRPSYSGAL